MTIIVEIELCKYSQSKPSCHIHFIGLHTSVKNKLIFLLVQKREKKLALNLYSKLVEFIIGYLVCLFI
jgi:hypothetical protein